ncbi:NAD(P)/FAD-dependent oxidoreductase [Rhodococcus aerolatus]
MSRVVVVGGGHNGLVAAILAAQDGHDVTLLERGAHPGGATAGARVFAGRTARLSRYSYLVSLLPEDLLRRVGVRLALRRRAVASYTPVGDGGLLVEQQPGPATAASFRALTGSDDEHAAYLAWGAELSGLARAVAPALQGPMWTRDAVRRAVVDAAGEQVWEDVVEAPLGTAVRRRFARDTVRGVVATDGLIGTHASVDSESLRANRCLLYHVVGRGTGEWLVPVGGMGALADALVARAAALGVRVHTGVEVDALAEDGRGVDVGAGDRSWRAEHVLAAVAPSLVRGWLGGDATAPEGSQLKENLLLTRLPRLRSGVDPAVAFAGTTHLAEELTTLEDAYARTAAGELPAVLPGEVYCHSLTDPSILGADGGATLTLFGLHAPASLFRADPDGLRDRARDAALAALQQHLAEPLEDCLARDADGRPCVEVATPLDLEASLGMPGGHIFHGDLSWPWLDEEPATVAQRWGVEVAGSRRVLLAGAGSHRGGAVSGLGGAAAVGALREL